MLTGSRRILVLALATLPACECNGIPIGDDGGINLDALVLHDSGDAATTDGGAADAGTSIACYISTQFRCLEYPNPSATKVTEVQGMCSSVSGAPSQPAACPSSGFGGKCTRPANEGYIERFYTGADLAYAQDFCVNTAMGTWSTTF